MASLILGIAALVLSVAGYGVSEGMSAWGKSVRGRLTGIANEIYTKMAKNQQYLDKLYQAYQDRNAGLINSMYVQAGFGPATEALRKEIESTKKKYQDEKSVKDTEQTKLTNAYNEVNQAISNAGGSIAGNVGGDEVADKIENQLNQSIEGGLTNA